MEYNPEKRLTIAHWAEQDRPREKLVLKGKSALSDAELLAILIGSGTVSESAVEVSKKVLQYAENDLNKLARFSIKDLKKIKGIGEAKAISIIAALEIGRRRKESDETLAPVITSSAQVWNYMQADLLDLVTEQFWVLLLNRANRIIKKVKISEGGLSATVVDIRIVFKEAIENLATGMILIHNHPSGQLKPSTQDISLTKRFKEAGATLDILILDHVIFTNKSYYSFADNDWT